jgi:6-phosphogluconolactonase
MRLTKILILMLLFASSAWAESATVWIGMDHPNNGEREGIYRSTLDLDSGALERPVLAAEIYGPEFLTLHPRGNVLYAACQVDMGVGAVAAYRISDDGRSLNLLNIEPTGAGQACHVAVDRSGHCLFSAQYGDGTISAYKLSADGRISPGKTRRHSGSGPNRLRQEGPHPHWVGTDPKNHFLFVPDLGSDQVLIYRFDPSTFELTAHGAGRSPAGSGPRHLVFHPNGRFVYVVNELKVTVTGFRYDAAAGTLNEIQTADMLREKPKVQSTAAEICIHPSGRFVYASTRGDDSIMSFRIDSETGRLSIIEREPIRGSHPRNINLDPTGKWLLAAGRDSNTISVFRIDQDSGRLIYSGHTVNSPAPICIEMQLAKQSRPGGRGCRRAAFSSTHAAQQELRPPN